MCDEHSAGNNYVRSLDNPENIQQMAWGHIRWLVGTTKTPGVEQTFGVVTILPGKHNPLHLHPNCEEILYVLSGECDNRLGEAVYHLTPGTSIQIPRQIPHNAHCTSAEPLVAVISFSSPDRQVINLDDGDNIA